MAAVLDKKDPAAPFVSQVDGQIAEATSRIRTHDLIFGTLVLVSMMMIYATAMIVLDKAVTLPDWVRQVSLLGFVAAFAGTAYWVIVRPLMKRINPLYAAKQVESTIDDNKNSVTGYVDAKEKGNLNATVKAALASRAAQATAEADMNRAVNHRSLMIAGGIAVAFLLTLIVLFFVFRPAQFASYLNRTFIPFASAPPKAQTELTLTKPTPADATVTTGQPIIIGVHVGGKIPKAGSPQQVRLMVRNNPDSPDYDILPMPQADTERDYELRVPDYLVSNGFWYKVAAGDAETEEHHVTVRSVPMFTDFDQWQITYEYPKYLRWKPDTSSDPNIRAYRGTKITITAKTNRDVRDGVMMIEPSNTRVPGVPVAGDTKSLQFSFKVTEEGRYKLAFTSTEGETTPNAFTAAIKVDADQAPQAIITKPEEAEPIEVPANGQLVVNGKIGDDFGIDTVTLKMRLVEPANLQRPLPDVPYLNGKSKSFLREKDSTWPTDLEYKGSVDFTKLKKDGAGVAFELTPGMVIEYWLEATDNCTEPKSNVGRSQVKQVRIGEPQKEPEDQQRIDERKENRQQEEQKHNDQQKQKNDTEKRDPKQQPQKGDQKKEGDNKKEGGQKREDEQKNGEKNSTDNKDGKPQEKNPNDPNKQNGMPDNNMGQPNNTDPMNRDNKDMKDMGNNPMNGNPMNDMTNPKNDQNPQPNNNNGQQNNQNREDIEKTAKEFEDQIKQENKDGASAKRNPKPSEENRANPGDAKPQPKDGMRGNQGQNASEPKPDAKQPNDPMTNPMNPMDGKNNSPSESKNEGKLEKGQDPATPKPDQQKPNEGANGQKNDEKNAPAAKRDEPLGTSPGSDKESPKESQPDSKNPNQKQDPKSGSTGKPSTEKKNENTDGMPNANEQKDPAGEAGSGPKPPMRDPTRANDKPSDNKQKGTQTSDPKPNDAKDGDKPTGGDAKPQTAPNAGDSKPKPKDDMTNPGANKPSETKPENDAKGAADTKPDDTQKNPMGSGDKRVEKGQDKPRPQDGKDTGKDNRNAGGSNDKKQPDPEKMKELGQAAKDLNSPDKGKREAAQQKLDNAIGEDKRKDLEQLQKDLNSPDKDKREAAQKKVEEALKSAKNQDPKNAPKPSEQEKKDLEEAVKNLNSPDKDKREAAQNKLDKTIGEDKRKEMEQLQKDLNSPDKDKKAAAEKKLQEMKDKMKDGATGNQQPEKNNKPLTEEQKKELQEAAKDLNSPDENKRKGAQQKLDNAIGEQNRKNLEKEMDQLKKDLNSPDKDKQEAAKKKIEDAMKNAKNQDPKDAPKLSEQEKKELEQAAKDLNSPDKGKREAAQNKLDKTIGEDKRKEMEQLQKDLNSPDKDKKAAAEKKLQEMKKQMEQDQANKNGQPQPGKEPKEPSQEEIADLMKKAQDLNSKDDKTREQAEKDLDDKIGQENRQKLQEEMKNQKPDQKQTPQQANDLKQKMEEWQQGLGKGTQAKGPMEENKRNREKNAELNLENFKKDEYRQQLQKSKGWTDEQYEKFLKDYEDYVKGLKNESASGKPVAPPQGTDPSKPLTAGGAEKVAPTSPSNNGPTTVGGKTNPPPGFEGLKGQFQDAIRNKKP